MTKKRAAKRPARKRIVRGMKTRETDDSKGWVGVSHKPRLRSSRQTKIAKKVVKNPTKKTVEKNRYYQTQKKGIPVKTKDSAYITKKGVKVRSKAERVIADYLSRNNIDYEYEKEIEYMEGEAFLCDFYLPKYDCYVEYFGMIDHHDEKTRKEYVGKTKWKIEVYERWKKKLIYLYPEDLQNPDFDERFQYKLKYVNSK